MAKLKKLISLIAVLFYSALAASAVEPITVTADRPELPYGETLSVSFVINDPSYQNFSFPAQTSDFRVLATSSSTSIQIINGVSSQSKSYNYIIQPLHKGDITIPSASVKKGATEFNTQPLIIKVTEAQTQPNNQSQLSAKPVSQGSLDPYVSKFKVKPIFVQSKISKADPYVNEQINLKLKVFHRGNLRGINFPPFNINNFTVVREDKAREYTEVVDKVEYLVYELNYILYPLKSGKLVLPKYEFNAIVIDDASGITGIDPFNIMGSLFTEKRLVLNSEPINLNVQDLPPGAPKNFSGYVGDLAVHHEISSYEITSDDAITIKTNIYGNGNKNNLVLNLIKDSKQFSVYKDKESSSSEIEKNKQFFEINTSSVIVSERKSGRVNIAVQPLISFNPKTRQYESHGEEEFEVIIKASTEEKEEDSETKTIKKKIDNEVIKTVTPVTTKEIIDYKPWNSVPNWLLASIITCLNLIFYLRRILMKKRRNEALEQKLNTSKIKKAVKKAKDIKSLSLMIKELEKETRDLSDQTISEELNDLIQRTDRINYGLKNDINSKDLEEIKLQTLGLVNSLKKVKSNG